MVKFWFSWIFFILFFIYCSGETNSKKEGLNVDEKIYSTNSGDDKITVEDWLNKFLNRTNKINEESDIKLDELIFDESSIIDRNNKLQNMPELIENENDDQSYEYDTNVPEYSESAEESITPKIIAIKKHQSEKESIEEPFVYTNVIKKVENFVQKSGSDFQDGSATVNEQIFVEKSEGDNQKISNIDQNGITKIEMKIDGIQDIVLGTIEKDFEHSENGSKNYGLQNKADNTEDDEYEYNTNVPEYSESAEDSSVPRMTLTEKRESETKNELTKKQNSREITIALMHKCYCHEIKDCLAETWKNTNYVKNLDKDLLTKCSLTYLKNDCSIGSYTEKRFINVNEKNEEKVDTNQCNEGSKQLLFNHKMQNCMIEKLCFIDDYEQLFKKMRPFCVEKVQKLSILNALKLSKDEILALKNEYVQTFDEEFENPEKPRYTNLFTPLWFFKLRDKFCDTF